ncbi:MAG: hypothetical protein JWP92_3050 [Caulobacter sp.]|nr:hypothetical protein [Caulobacter sp.]
MGPGSLQATPRAAPHRRRAPTGPFLVILVLCGGFWAAVALLAMQLL